MTTSPAAPAQAAVPQPPADPFRFGWRYLRRQLPSSELVFEPQPLTLDDVHYPQEGDFIVHSSKHTRIRIHLYNALRDLPDVVVLTDVRAAWDVPGLRPLGLDSANRFVLRLLQE